MPSEGNVDRFFRLPRDCLSRVHSKKTNYNKIVPYIDVLCRFRDAVRSIRPEFKGLGSDFWRKTLHPHGSSTFSFARQIYFFFLFPKMKTALMGQRFHGVDQVKNTMRRNSYGRISKNDSQKWLGRWMDPLYGFRRSVFQRNFNVKIIRSDKYKYTFCLLVRILFDWTACVFRERRAPVINIGTGVTRKNGERVRAKYGGERRRFFRERAARRSLWYRTVQKKRRRKNN